MAEFKTCVIFLKGWRGGGVVEPHVSPHISAVLFVNLSVYMFLLCNVIEGLPKKAHVT